MSGPAETFDVAVIGGGIIGCAIAWELARRGPRVVLLERERLAAGASGAAAGMLAPQSEAQGPGAWLDLLLRARDGWTEVSEELRAETGVSVEYQRGGVLRVAMNAEERAELVARVAWQRELGLEVEWLATGEACRREPALSPEVAGALWAPREAQLRPARAVQALAAAAAAKGVVVREGQAVYGALRSGRRVSGVSTSAGIIHCGAVVAAAGAWSAWLPELAGLPLGPVKGQIVAAQVPPEGGPRHIVWGRGAYITPKAGGELFIGATEEEGVFDARPTLGALAGLVTRASQLVPCISHLPLLASWAGLRPALPDRLPVLAASPELQGLYVATGHFRNGILLAPVTADAVSGLLATGELPDGFARFD
ncbi:MAG: glycine oxidase ThiO, partial [Chloroflexota bacterium]